MIYLGYRTALQFWRSAQDGTSQILPRISPMACRDKICPVDPSDVLTQHDLLGIPAEILGCGPLDVVVFDERLKRKGNGCVYHGQYSPLPVGSFLRIGDNLAIANPELTFVQMSEEIPLLLLIKYGIELCGTYSLGMSKGDRLLIRQQPHTSVERLEDYVGRINGKHGIKNARKALKHVVDMSASPSETAAEMVFCLPPRLGGFGLWQPGMNTRVDYDEEGRKMTGKSFAKCDLCWLEALLDVEINSAQYHGTYEQIVNDQARANALKHLKFKIISITNEQLRDFDSMACIAADIAKILGMRITLDNAEINSLRREVHRIILSAEGDVR